MSSGEESALRKRVLVMRAGLERMELADRVEALRDTARPSALLRAALPGLAVSKGIPMLVNLFKRYPFLGSGASLAVSRIAAHAAKPLARRVIAIGGLGLLAWQGWQLIQKIRPGKDTAKPQA